jgi:hypothetical protein
VRQYESFLALVPGSITLARVTRSRQSPILISPQPRIAVFAAGK